jgi:hypothetical protein
VNIPTGISRHDPWADGRLRHSDRRCHGVGMRGANSNTSAAGRPGRSQRPASLARFGWSTGRPVVDLNASRPRRSPRCSVGLPPTRFGAFCSGSGGARAGGGRIGPPLPRSCRLWREWGGRMRWSCGRTRRAGRVGQPVREVARVVGVHPATVCRWIRQAVRRWAEADGIVDRHSGRAAHGPGQPGCQVCVGGVIVWARALPRPCRAPHAPLRCPGTPPARGDHVRMHRDRVRAPPAHQNRR